ncbi:MAG: hypothetical protein WCR63_04265 [Bacilli bacterium]
MAKRKIDNNKRKLLTRLSFAVLILSSAASVSVSTYAFAASSSLLTLSDIGVQTLVPAEIKIGLKNTSTEEVVYYDELDEDSFLDNGLSSPKFTGLYPVSSSFKSKWLIKDQDGTYDSVTPKFTREYYNSENYDFPGWDTNTEHYLQMELFFKEEDTASLPVNFYLSDLTSMVADTDKNKITAVDISTDQDKLDQIVNCLRASILTQDDYYIIDFNKEENVTLAGRLNVIDNNEYYDTTFGNEYEGEEPNKELLFGEYENEDKIVWDDVLENDTGLLYPDQTSSAFNAKSAAGTKPLNIEESINNGVILKEEDSIALEDLVHSNDSGKEENKILFSLNPGEEKRIVVTYYIEGWDLDNNNEVQYASFISNLVFTGEYDYSYLD